MPPKKGGKRRKKYAQTDEEFMESYVETWKREYAFSIEMEATSRLLEAEKKKDDLEEFRNRCESLDYLFSPSEGRLIDYYLRSKYLNKEIDFCPIDEVDVNASNLQTLIDHFRRTPGKVGYYFSRCCVTDIHSAANMKGLWTFSEKEDVIEHGKKVGVKQVVEYCEDDHSTGLKIIEYQLDPAPADQKAVGWRELSSLFVKFKLKQLVSKAMLSEVATYTQANARKLMLIHVDKDL